MARRTLTQSNFPSVAVILAAGRGTRLHPLTESVPKPMMRIAGRPILAHVVERLRAFGVKTVIVNLHHVPDPVREYFGDGHELGVSIIYSIESTLLGTAGAVANVRGRLTDSFLVWYGDNLSTCHLDRLYSFHRRKGGIATIALFHREDPTSSGVGELDRTNRVTRFLEKPRACETSSRWVNAGIYVLEQEVLGFIPPGVPSDFGRDVFPAMLAAGREIYGYRMGPHEGLWWIDTIGDLRRAELAWAGGER